MSKLKYRLRNILFPRKHSEEVKTIRTEQLYLRAIIKELRALENLCEYGIPGDSMVDRMDALRRAYRYYNNHIAELKQKYKS